MARHHIGPGGAVNLAIARKTIANAKLLLEFQAKQILNLSALSSFTWSVLLIFSLFFSVCHPALNKKCLLLHASSLFFSLIQGCLSLFFFFFTVHSKMKKRTEIFAGIAKLIQQDTVILSPRPRRPLWGFGRRSLALFPVSLKLTLMQAVRIKTKKEKKKYELDDDRMDRSRGGGRGAVGDEGRPWICPNHLFRWHRFCGVKRNRRDDDVLEETRRGSEMKIDDWTQERFWISVVRARKDKHDDLLVSISCFGNLDFLGEPIGRCLHALSGVRSIDKQPHIAHWVEMMILKRHDLVSSCKRCASQRLQRLFWGFEGRKNWKELRRRRNNKVCERWKTLGLEEKSLSETEG